MAAAQERERRVDAGLSQVIATLAIDEQLSAYDAGYVAGARRLDATLVSCDEHALVNAGLATLPTSLTDG